MGAAGRLLCKLGKHDRSRGSAKRKSGTWVSRCRRCNTPLIRQPGGKWIVIRAEEQLAEDEIVQEDADQALPAVEIIDPDQEAAEPIPEPEDPPRRSAFRRTMRYLWYGRG